MRTFGVEEELLLVDAESLEPLPRGMLVVAGQGDTAPGSHSLTTEFKQEQVEVNSPPQNTLAEQLAAIRTGRTLAQKAAALAGGTVVALPLDPGNHPTHIVPGERNQQIRERFGATAFAQLTNGFHIHVAINSREEAVIALDRIRVWLPVLLALSGNSPFAKGVDSGFASYRYQKWTRWPNSGPTEMYGSATAYETQCQALFNSQVPLDAGMLYFDARPSDHQPTIEVRVADVCLKAEHAAVIAAITRALVETAIRNQDQKPPPVPVTVLRSWTWQASRYGVDSELIQPHTGKPAPAAEVVDQLLDGVRPVLTEYNELSTVETVVTDILQSGSGARIQRAAYAQRHDFYDVMQAALEATHEYQDPKSIADRSPIE